MPSTINAAVGGIINTADSSGALNIQTSGVTAISITSGQAVTLASALPVGSGGTGATTLAGANIAVFNVSNIFTAAQTFRAANAVRSEVTSVQDAIVIAGRAGGSSSYAVTFTPATLSANRTATMPDASGTVVLNTQNSGANINLDALFGGF